MDEQQKIKVVDRLKACEILGCKHTDFYTIYYKKLKDSSIFGKDKRKRLYLLDEVMSLKSELESINVDYELIQ